MPPHSNDEDDGIEGGDESKSPKRLASRSKVPSLSRLFAYGVAALAVIVAAGIKWFFRFSPEDELRAALIEELNYPATLSGAARAELMARDARDRRYTVRLNTFRRNELLQVAVPHYARCPNVEAVQVIWSDLSRAPPPPSFFNAAAGDDAGPLHVTYSRHHPAAASAAPSSSGPTTRRGAAARVEFEVHDVDSLNNRFRPLARLPTEGVFSVDDDLAVPCATLDLAHTAWRQSPRAMVGFMPRMHGVARGGGEGGGSFTYLDWWHVWRHGVYSLILTKACFLHRDFLTHYTAAPALGGGADTGPPRHFSRGIGRHGAESGRGGGAERASSTSSSPAVPATAFENRRLAVLSPRPRRGGGAAAAAAADAVAAGTGSGGGHTPLAAMGHPMRAVHEYVDAHMNCEDLAMSFLVANLTRAPSVWVRGQGVREIGTGGLSSNQAQHYAARSGCLNAFVALIGNGRMPLVPAATKVDRASAFWLWR